MHWCKSRTVSNKREIYPPAGYKFFSKTESIRWVIQITPEGEMLQIEEPRTLMHALIASDQERPAKITSNHTSSSIRRGMRFGIPQQGKPTDTKLLHRGFVTLLSECADATQDRDLTVILQFLNTRASSCESARRPLLKM